MKGIFHRRESAPDPNEPIIAVVEEYGGNMGGFSRNQKSRELTGEEVTALKALGASVRNLFADPDQIPDEVGSEALRQGRQFAGNDTAVYEGLNRGFWERDEEIAGGTDKKWFE